MWRKTLICCSVALLVSGTACLAEPEKGGNSTKLKELNAGIQAAYQAQDLEKAASLFQQMIPIMKKEYGENDVAVGQTLRNYAYLLSSRGRKQDATRSAEEAAKILLAKGTDTTIGNSKLGRYSLRCPASYESKCRGGVGDDSSWVSTYEFFDAPVKSGQQYTWRAEVFEYAPDLPGHFRYGSLNDYLSGCYADNEVLSRAKPIVIDGITFDRAVVCTITPGDYRENPSKQMGTIYFAHPGKNVIILQCRSRVGGFPITLALLEPAFRTFRKLK
jgi:hypothetical protein